MEQRFAAAEQNAEATRKALADQVKEAKETLAVQVKESKDTLAEQVQMRFTATQLAIDKAEKADSDRLSTINAALQALATRAETFITRGELAILLDKVAEQNASLVQDQIHELDNKSEMRLISMRREFEVWREGYVLSQQQWQSGLQREMKLTDDAVRARFESQERAVVKADEMLREYKAGANDVRGVLADMSNRALSRTEAESKWNQLRELIDMAATERRQSLAKLEQEIATLRESNSQKLGRDEAVAANQEQGNWNNGQIVAVALGLLSLITSVGLYIAAHH
ncbi:MAG: hypothetical protein DLM66_00120 [Candidatus Dormiibacter spiritus]|nr:MAG: hypothetical protein DLM66_00120 [Candidatus Dormibacteraeota bacterium]